MSEFFFPAFLSLLMGLDEVFWIEFFPWFIHARVSSTISKILLLSLFNVLVPKPVFSISALEMAFRRVDPVTLDTDASLIPKACACRRT